MHSVQRSNEPMHLAQLRRDGKEWSDLDFRDRARMRRGLSDDFKGICGYCEKSCEPPTRSGNSRDEETIDHFRPRRKFPALSFDWQNLVYCCKQCNDAKGGQWPESADQVNQVLNVGYARYIPVDRYVDPNFQQGQRSAHDYFDFDVDTGEIQPARRVNSEEWSTSFRMIRDLDLNDSYFGENDPRNVRNRRLRHLAMLKNRLKNRADSEMIGVALEFISPDRPFSSFVNAYFRRTFPMLYDMFPT